MLKGVTPTLMDIVRNTNINPWFIYRDNTTVEETLAIIDDALCHAFEFKVENGNLYYREIV